jgi:hypothetical protein
MNADYCAEASMRAVDLLFDVLITCRDRPKRTDSDAVHRASSYSPAINAMLTDLRVSRDAVPLANGRPPVVP